MRSDFSLLQNHLIGVTLGLLLLSTSCKSRNAAWSDLLAKQMKRDSPLNSLDSSMHAFIMDYHIPAVSITAAKDGGIIYSHAFGMANLSTGEEARHESLFRMVGTSTTITSLAIRELVGQGKISYESKVFGEGSILGTNCGNKPNRSLLAEITIADLLNHTSGAWAGEEDMILDNDFRGLFSSKDTALSRILDNTVIKVHPGSTFGFSYTGYFILGRVIEKITGMPYEKWVKENILQPCGIADMEVEDDSLPNLLEVAHYRDLVWPRYNGDIDEKLYLSRADAALGWIASSSDLVKLMVKFGNADSLNPTIISNSIPILHAPNSGSGFVPDWSSTDLSTNWWEQIHFYGSTSILVRSTKGFCWSILINTYRRFFRLRIFQTSIRS